MLNFFTLPEIFKCAKLLNDSVVNYLARQMLVTFTELEINGEEHEKVTSNIHYADGFA